MVLVSGQTVGLILALQLSWTVLLSSAYVPSSRLYQAAAFVVQRSQQQLLLQRQQQQPAALLLLHATVVEKEETAEEDEMVISDELMKVMEDQAVAIAEEIMDDISCEVIPETGMPADEMCVDEEKRMGFRATLLESSRGLLKAWEGGRLRDVKQKSSSKRPPPRKRCWTATDSRQAVRTTASKKKKRSTL
jgi:hypothetical protein